MLFFHHDALFHISQEPAIQQFIPRPSPSHFEGLQTDVVFAITQQLLHNYLLPRDCPRVTWYAVDSTTAADKARFLTGNTAYVVAIEQGWLPLIKATTLYCYQLPAQSFRVLDAGAGYYVSEEPVIPVSVTVMDDVLGALQNRNIELRILPELWELADAVAASTMQYSIIRMRNATPRKQ
ncbi:hypothetical protein SAMN05421788_101734 [Filimonas lacunae]|uniref:Uncharacterized protein n=1 Tax=Filimonas lacunae TaxID=477680 RepID=A0A173MNS1_9BACT|nr:DUF6886 family protein [Filimonas lacunae]BAV09293.1 hypothetical protein FLA_5341 [Filimonas lacunae]SIS70626.1 hypothetical protein SAMN05421788_101734 [Filimonas lacunae]